MKTKLMSILLTATLLGGSVVISASAESFENVRRRTISLDQRVQALQAQVDKINTGNENNYDHDLLVEMYAHGPAIVTSPALGVRRSAEDGKDLMINLPSVHEDLALLKIRQKMDNYALENNVPVPQRPIIAMSGGVEGRVQSVRPNGQVTKADVNLSRAELDIIGEAGPWATAAMIITYDDDKSVQIQDNNNKPATVYLGRRANNAKLRIDRGFITIGQLNKSPVYMSIGQMFAPFGSYSSYMVTTPSTNILGKTKDRMVVLGMYLDQGLYAQAFAHPGETKIADGQNFFNNTGFNLGCEFSQDQFKIDASVGVIGNLAESGGMQDAVYGVAGSITEKIKSSVMGINGRFKASYDKFNLLAEYVGAAKKFDKADLSFNGYGAQPKAFQVEGAVEFDIKGKPNTFALGYGRTWQALGLKLPEHTYFASYAISLLKNTILSLEYKYGIEYGSNDKGGRDPFVVQTFNYGGEMNGSNIHTNTFTVQLGVYF